MRGVMLEVPPHLLEERPRARGLKAAYEIGFFLADDDYRVPDLAVYRPDQASSRGLEARAELVIELVSPGDESRAKLPWYLAYDVREVILVDRDSLAVDLYVPGQEAVPERVEPAWSQVLGCSFEWLGADRLTVVTDGRRVQITP
jgi:Uma2 family endonuclease